MNDRKAVGSLALGTAQWGGSYGVANQDGRPSQDATTAVLDLAVGAGVLRFDTAAGYGDAEVRLGRYLRRRSLQRQIDVVTKLAIADPADEVAVRAAVARCQTRLGLAPSLLLHDPELLDSWHGPLAQALQTCRADGVVNAIGVSIYHPEQFAIALELPGVEVIQVPFSVLDRRVEQAGLLEQADRRGVRVMLRSVFLQGLLLLAPDRCPTGLTFAAGRLRAWQSLCASHGVDPITAALRFVLQRAPATATVVVGCESEAQLRELLAAADSPDLPDALVADLEGLATSDVALLDPTRWSL